MVRDILSNKWVLGGTFFLVVFAIGCIFWYQHDIAHYRAQAAETEKLLEQREPEQVIPSSGVETILTKAPAENATAEKSIDTSPETVDNTTEAETNQASETSAEIAVNSDMPVSPYGYGPYPDVPDDYREAKGKPIWEHSKWPDEIALPEGAELLDRVLIKVWKEGKKDWIGASHENGKVRLNYPNTLYIWYGEPYEDKDGNIIKPIRRAKGDPNARLTGEEKRRGMIPSGVRILDGETAGINVFEYLNLSTK